MTAVTGDYSLNFSGTPNESPWVEDNWVDVDGPFQINTNGLRPVADTAVSILAGQTWETTIRSKIEIISNSMTYGDYLGPAIIVEGGSAYTGYVLRCNGENLDVSKYIGGIREGLISTSVGTVADGDTYELQVDASGASAIITAYRNGSQITALNYTDSDSPFLADLAGGIFGSAENSNGRRIGSVAFDGLADTPPVTNPGLRINGIHQPNADALVANDSAVDAVVYDVIGGVELWQGSVEIAGGGFEIDNDAVGSIGDDIFLVARWDVVVNPGTEYERVDEYTYAATETVVDLDA